jgi:hypothetical protein
MVIFTMQTHVASVRSGACGIALAGILPLVPNAFTRQTWCGLTVIAYAYRIISTRVLAPLTSVKPTPTLSTCAS